MLQVVTKGLDYAGSSRQTVNIGFSGVEPPDTTRKLGHK
jgi:hypothetical protein